mmetsp:Transcript_55750/g.110483  ORF Transcript_55750/g.110483 Transcript_55750/m.110483 type:complete len:228 (-) Transcript_55750:189-872(-)
MISPWLIRYLQNLEDDGIQAEEDVGFITDDIFDQWEMVAYRPHKEEKSKNVFDPEWANADPHELTMRYPKVVIEKLRAMRDHLEEQAETKKKAGPTALKLTMKPTTQAALRKRGVVWAHDLRLASEEVLDGIVNELVADETPPMPIAWATLEEMAQEVKLYGCPCPCMRSWYNPPLSKQGQARCEKVVQASNDLLGANAEARQAVRAAVRGGAQARTTDRTLGTKIV